MTTETVHYGPRGYVKTTPRVDRFRIWGPKDPALAAAVEQARNLMSAQLQSLGDLLTELGYEPNHVQIDKLRDMNKCLKAIFDRHSEEG